MSVDFNFINRSISYDEIREKTDLEIVHVNNGDWLKDKYGNVVHIVGSNKEGLKLLSNTSPKIKQICKYASSNALYIVDTLVSQFGLLFITCEYEMDLYHLPDGTSQDEINALYRKLISLSLLDYGIKADNFPNCTFIIPTRDEEEYQNNNI